MSRLISYDYIRQKALADPDSGEAVVYLQDIDEAPTVDAVEVVRCRGCKHWCFETGLCNLHSNFSKSVLHFFDEYDFCSYGERKEGDD